MMKLCVIHINAESGSEPYTAKIDAIFNKIKREDTTIVHRWAKLKRASDTIYSYPYLLNKVDVIHRFVEADREGFDGAMVACSGDPGVAEARSLTSIPIVGPFEAALHLACGYAYKFGVVTVEDRAWADVCEMLVASNGLISRCVGVRRIDIPSKEAFTTGFVEPSAMLQEIEKQARYLVDHGASAILIGSAGMSCIASTGGLVEIPGLGVPVFDVLSVGLKTLEMRVDLSQKLGIPVTSRCGYMEQFPAKDADRVRKLFAF
jgi:allantoin racemase